MCCTSLNPKAATASHSYITYRLYMYVHKATQLTYRLYMYVHKTTQLTYTLYMYTYTRLLPCIRTHIHECTHLYTENIDHSVCERQQYCRLQPYVHIAVYTHTLIHMCIYTCIQKYICTYTRVYRKYRSLWLRIRTTAVL